MGDGNWLVGEVSFPSEQAFLIFLFLVGCIVGVCCLYMGYLMLFSSLLDSFSKKTVVFGCGLQKNAEYATHILMLAHFNFFYFIRALKRGVHPIFIVSFTKIIYI